MIAFRGEVGYAVSAGRRGPAGFSGLGDVYVFGILLGPESKKRRSSLDAQNTYGHENSRIWACPKIGVGPQNARILMFAYIGVWWQDHCAERFFAAWLRALSRLGKEAVRVNLCSPERCKTWSEVCCSHRIPYPPWESFFDLFI